MGSGVNRVMVGSVPGTGSAINVDTVGFRPRVVKLVNGDSDDELLWSSSMGDAAGYKRLKAGGGAMISADGVTPRTAGFTIGADSDINASTEIVHWVAWE